jgi:hypothetical protein
MKREQGWGMVRDLLSHVTGMASDNNSRWTRIPGHYRPQRSALA